MSQLPAMRQRTCIRVERLQTCEHRYRMRKYVSKYDSLSIAEIHLCEVDFRFQVFGDIFSTFRGRLINQPWTPVTPTRARWSCVCTYTCMYTSVCKYIYIYIYFLFFIFFLIYLTTIKRNYRLHQANISMKKSYFARTKAKSAYM